MCRNALLALAAAGLFATALSIPANASTNSVSGNSFTPHSACGPSPYVWNNGAGIIVPLGSCNPNWSYMQQNYSQNATGFQLYGQFAGNNYAPNNDSSCQEAFYLCDDVSGYGHEFGIYKQLNNMYVYGYIQDPPGGNGHFFYTSQPIQINPNSSHTYAAKCAASYGGPANQIDFYVDGNYVTSVTDPNGGNWNGLNYTLMANCENHESNWNPMGGSNPDQLEIWSGIETF
jgi:hypothetical protein